jgi:glycosyltransferase involved in cell wall biosynthesis
MYMLSTRHLKDMPVGTYRKGVAADVPETSPVLSIIASTKGSDHQTARLLSSLETQSCQDFELIIVEQNPTSLLGSLIEQDWSFPIAHVHTPRARGVSRARNAGLARASGEFVLFPDDDCWYPETFLESGLRQLRDKKLDLLTGRPATTEGKTSSGRFEMEAQWIRRATVWTTQIEWIAFWRRDLLQRLGGYDEMIGVGADSPWRSAEGQDLMLRALSADARCWYDPDLIAHDKVIDPNQADAALIKRARAYGRGVGHVLRKHRMGIGTLFYFISRSVGGALLAAARGRFALAKFHIATGIGRFEGMFGRCFGNFEYDKRLISERSPPSPSTRPGRKG